MPANSWTCPECGKTYHSAWDHHTEPYLLCDCGVGIVNHHFTERMKPNAQSYYGLQR